MLQNNLYNSIIVRASYLKNTNKAKKITLQNFAAVCISLLKSVYLAKTLEKYRIRKPSNIYLDRDLTIKHFS